MNYKLTWITSVLPVKSRCLLMAGCLLLTKQHKTHPHHPLVLPMEVSVLLSMDRTAQLVMTPPGSKLNGSWIISCQSWRGHHEPDFLLLAQPLWAESPGKSVRAFPRRREDALLQVKKVFPIGEQKDLFQWYDSLCLMWHQGSQEHAHSITQHVWCWPSRAAELLLPTAQYVWLRLWLFRPEWAGGLNCNKPLAVVPLISLQAGAHAKNLLISFQTAKNRAGKLPQDRDVPILNLQYTRKWFMEAVILWVSTLTWC